MSRYIKGEDKNQLLYNKSKPDTKEKVYKNPEACNKCEYRDACTENKFGRFIKRGPYQDIYEEVDKRTEQNKEIYK
ncbi:hypothetical protein SAMN05446037_102177 [Anaerovirgula multivorans]|uniref:Uncharacterized protein n=1 Tax=Anaerovirgula multivorans TaxID=312168 RepID=A0A239HGN9_9FIRM|nr:hypothetical protein SAMN05446037_102177 [Anaerovirgula multivorans]